MKVSHMFERLRDTDTPHELKSIISILTQSGFSKSQDKDLLIFINKEKKVVINTKTYIETNDVGKSMQVFNNDKLVKFFNGVRTFTRLMVMLIVFVKVANHFSSVVQQKSNSERFSYKRLL